MAVAQLRSAQAGAGAAGTLYRLLRNVASWPQETKYRKLRLSNPKIQAAVVDIDGALELLQACGFQMVFEGGQGAEGDQSGEEGYLVLPLEAPLRALVKALELLEPMAGPQVAAGGKSIDPASLPRPRHTQVLLPVAPEVEIPDWFFDRTPNELKFAYQSAVRRRQQEAVLLTRAQREAKQPPPKVHTHAVIRVRLPEGVVLQGEFNAGEPVSAIFNWVTSSLQSPELTYDLVQPTRKPLAVSATSVRAAELVPATTLNFHWTDASMRGVREVHTLNDELLQTAQPAA